MFFYLPGGPVASQPFNGYAILQSTTSSATNRLKEKYIYARRTCTVSDAAGVTGILCKTTREGRSAFFLRVKEPMGGFTDYDLLHDDLTVTIAQDALASFYSGPGVSALEHGPQVLGLCRVEDDGAEKPADAETH